jgi:hypothetical protein
MKNLLRSLFVAAGFATAVAAYAAVSFDPATGQGFIGRGDVIDHPDLGKNALVQNPVITLEISVSYEVDISWTTGPDHNISTHTNTKKKSLDVVSVAQVDTRRNRGNDNITGYLLLGYVDDSEAEDAFTPPFQVGDVILENNGIEKVVTAVRMGEGSSVRLRFAATPTELVGWFDL